VSEFWAGGTFFAAAMTPVVVAIVKEMLERPIKSDTVRRSASRVADVATARRAIAGTAAARTERERRSTPGTGTIPHPPAPNGNGAASEDAELTEGDVLMSHPRRTYGGAGPGGRFRRVHLKLAIVTGLLAFLIAAVVLTVPELLFGGSVGSRDGNTTIFGGGKSQSDERRDESENGGGGESQPQPQEGGDRAAPGPGPDPDNEAPPPAEEPAPSEPAPVEPAPAPAPAPAPPATP
jgi:hypothetical protein